MAATFVARYQPGRWSPMLVTNISMKTAVSAGNSHATLPVEDPGAVSAFDERGCGGAHGSRGGSSVGSIRSV